MVWRQAPEKRELKIFLADSFQSKFLVFRSHKKNELEPIRKILFLYALAICSIFSWTNEQPKVRNSNFECERCTANNANDKHRNDSTEKLRAFDSKNSQQTGGRKDAITEINSHRKYNSIESCRLDDCRNVYQVGDSRWLQIVWQTHGNQWFRSWVHSHHGPQWHWQIEHFGLDMLCAGNNKFGTGNAFLPQNKRTWTELPIEMTLFEFGVHVFRFGRVACKS